MANLVAKVIADRAEGVLIGLAAGDKNLGPTEMALMIAESLIDEKGFAVTDITSRWLSWWRRGAWDTGRVFDEVMSSIDMGKDPNLAAKDVHQVLGGMTAGCNGAHRVPVLSAFLTIEDRDLDDAARRLTHITHRHSLASDAAVAVARICRFLIRGMILEDAIRTSASGLDGKIASCLRAAATQPGGRDGFSPHALQSAVHFILTRPTFDEALSAALQYAGPPNYCPVLVGAIAGAHEGAKSLSEGLLTHCRDEARVRKVSKCLAMQDL